MSENKTRETRASVGTFMKKVEDEVQRRDCRKLMAMMKAATGKPAKMWGESIVGFDSYHYRYASGREGDMCLVGFSPRKKNIAVYIMPGFEGYATLMKKLGRHKTGKSCLYLNRLADVDEAVLRQLIDRAVRDMRKRYPA